MNATLDQLTGPEAEHVRTLIRDQMAIARDWRAPASKVRALPVSRQDFVQLAGASESELSTLRDLILATRLKMFPGNIEQARAIARYSISFEVYELQLRLAGQWLRVVRLRDGRVVHSGPTSESLPKLRDLDDRIAVVPMTSQNRDLVVRFGGELPAQPLELPSYPGARFVRSKATPVACRQEAGQCFIVSRE